MVLPKEEYRKRIKEGELITILKEELLPRHFYFERNGVSRGLRSGVSGEFIIYRKFPWTLVSNAKAYVYIYKNNSLLNDEIRTKGRYSLLDKILKNIAKRYGQIKGREMKLIFSSY